MLTDLLIVAASAAFVVSFVERWLDNALFRGLMSLVVSIVGVIILGYSGWVICVMSTASAFAALIMVLIGERLATPPPIAIDNRRR